MLQSLVIWDIQFYSCPYVPYLVYAKELKFLFSKSFGIYTQGQEHPKRKTKFNFALYHFFRFEVVPLFNLAGSGSVHIL